MQYAMMQRVNRYTSFILLYWGQKLRVQEEAVTGGKVAKFVHSGQTFDFSRQQATGLSVKRGCIVVTVASTSIYTAACLHIRFGRPTFRSCRLGVVDRPCRLYRRFPSLLHAHLDTYYNWRKNRNGGISSCFMCN